MSKSLFSKVLTALFLFLFVGAVYAESLDEDEARFAAVKFFNPSSQGSRLRASGLQLKLRSNGHEDGYYIFDRPEGGTVFVADDDAIGHTVLGFTDEGSFDAEDLPTGLQDWLEQISVLMDAVHEGKISRMSSPNNARQVVVSELIKTKWHQRSPYNDLCPMKNGERCITGCVATAMAQIMKYWRWPNHGYGSITYTDRNGCGQTLSQDFSKNNYNWNNMLNTYTGNYTTAQGTAVATLMRDCGYAVKMKYTPELSLANVNPRVMAYFFHYSTAAKERNSYLYPVEMWHEFIREDLLANRPVLYSGRTDVDNEGNDEGHQFILDGFDTLGYYHVNWGWGGTDDGWFILTNLNGFNNKQFMINELEPDRRENSGFSYTLSSGVLTISGSGSMPQEYDLDNAPWRTQSSNVRKIVISDGITNIPSYFGFGYNTGYNFSNLEELILPEGLLSIGGCAFRLSNLTSVQLPSSLVSMDESFWNAKLTSLHLPKGLVYYTDYLPCLEKLTIDEENPNLCVMENVLYSKDCKNLLFAPGGLSRIIVAETTKNVYDCNILSDETPIVFKGLTSPSLSQQIINNPKAYNCGYLFTPYGSKGYDAWKRILPSSWMTLTYRDFDYVPETKVTWELDGNTLTISGWGVQKYAEYRYNNAPYFPQKYSIKKLVVEEGVIGLCWQAYDSYYNLKEAILPSTLKYVDEYCFYYTDLSSITCYAKQAPTLGNSSVFYGVATAGILRVPQGSNYSSWINALPSGWCVEYFTPEPLARCYLYNGEQQEVSDLQEWEKLLLQNPNTIGIVSPGKEDWAYLTYNLLIEDALTSRYQCPYLTLTDLSYGYSSTDKIPKTGFAPPVPFDVSKGSYSRKWSRGYNTCCLPFAINQEELPEGFQMLTYSHFDTDKNDVIFVPQASSEAGCPFFVINENAAEWQVDLSGKTIVTQPKQESQDNIRGTFVTTSEYERIGYSPRAKDHIFAPLAQNLHPFRACILIDSSNAPAEIRARLADGDEATGVGLIDNGQVRFDNRQGIYTLDGKRLSSPIKGQLYIENGKIVIR